MSMNLFFKMLFFAAIASAFANAATLKGTVFDSSFQPVTAVVTVNSTPEQRLVAQNGSFSFEVPRGFFKITATVGNYSVAESVSIVSEGAFNLDLVVLGLDEPSLEIPGVSEESDLGETPQAQNGVQPQPASGFDWASVVLPIAVLMLAVMLFLFHREFKNTIGEFKNLQKSAFKRTPKAKHAGSAKLELPLHATHAAGGLSELQQEIVKELQKSEGRMNQKDLRKLLPFSEAKVSIELDFLEEKGIVKRFKKGRGNVIVLKK